MVSKCLKLKTVPPPVPATVGILKQEIMASQLLDYNQVVEQSPNTGDVISETGGMMSWDFRCDPNYSWDPSQSFFIMKVSASPKNMGASTATLGLTVEQYATLSHMVDHWPLRLFSSMTHIVDGVTIANTNKPFVDRFMQARYLKENTASNEQNLQAQLQQSGNYSVTAEDRSTSSFFENKGVDLGANNFPVTHYIPHFTSGTQHFYVMFQPPFDFWTKHQRCSGGNHQIQLNLRPAEATQKWGVYTVPWLKDVTVRTATDNTDQVVDRFGDGDYPKVEISELRLMRRMVRFNVQRPLSVQEFNLTEMALFQGQPLALSQLTHANTGQTSYSEQTSQFMLPSSTFGICIFFTLQEDQQDTPLGPQGPLGDPATIDQINSVDKCKNLEVGEIHFTYGGETYPASRIEGLSSSGTGSDPAPAMHKLQLLSHQLQGVFNMPMDYVKTQFKSQRSHRSLNDKMFYFPVAKHNNTDTSDLQITFSAGLSSTINAWNAANPNTTETRNVKLNVMAFYDARVEFAYNQGNQLERVTKTEWR